MNFDTTNWRVEKLISLDEAAEVVARLKSEGKKIVTVNGSFDILHAGHLDQLEEAKKQGDVLFVAINSDASVRNEKGKDRPFISEQARAALVAALACVDYVTIIDESYDDVPRVLIRAVKPDVHVNGPDYGPTETWREWEAMQEVGAAGYTAQKRNNLSTSDLITRIKKS